MSLKLRCCTPGSSMAKPARPTRGATMTTTRRSWPSSTTGAARSPASWASRRTRPVACFRILTTPGSAGLPSCSLTDRDRRRGRAPRVAVTMATRPGGTTGARGGWRLWTRRGRSSRRTQTASGRAHAARCRITGAVKWTTRGRCELAGARSGAGRTGTTSGPSQRSLAASRARLAVVRFPGVRFGHGCLSAAGTRSWPAHLRLGDAAWSSNGRGADARRDGPGTS